MVKLFLVLIVFTYAANGQAEMGLDDYFYSSPEISNVKDVKGFWKVRRFLKSAPGYTVEWNYTQGRFPTSGPDTPHMKFMKVKNKKNTIKGKFTLGLLKRRTKFEIDKIDSERVNFFERLGRRYSINCRVMTQVLDGSAMICRVQAHSGRYAYYCLTRSRKSRSACLL